MKGIKTFADAIKIIGRHHPMVEEWKTIHAYCSKDVEAFVALKIVAEALRRADSPEDEERYIPIFITDDEAGGDPIPAAALAGIGNATAIPVSLCVNSPEAARHFGCAFFDYWKDYLEGGDE